ncbi:MAG TPA: hypothetical protein VGN75_18170, partial [Kaistia sp.]|nr:hypothetical protein [Kaistia sp.]
DRFPSAAHERALDKLTVLVQQLGAELAGSIRLPEDEAGGVSAILPPAAIRAGRLVGFDAAGKLQLTTTELALDAILDAIEEAAASAASSAGAASVDRVASEAAAAAAVPAAEQAVVAARSARLDAATAANAASGISEFLKGPATTTAAAYGLPGKNLGDLDEAAPFWAERLPSVRIDLARGTGTTIDLGSVT